MSHQDRHFHVVPDMSGIDWKRKVKPLVATVPLADSLKLDAVCRAFFDDYGEIPAFHDAVARDRADMLWDELQEIYKEK